jgi:hypothetical protein
LKPKALRELDRDGSLEGRSEPVKPKIRGPVQHGGPPGPGWLEESDPTGCDRSMPPALTDRTAWPGLELLSCELLANPADVADDLVLNVNKTPS